MKLVKHSPSRKSSLSGLALAGSIWALCLPQGRKKQRKAREWKGWFGADLWALMGCPWCAACKQTDQEWCAACELRPGLVCSLKTDQECSGGETNRAGPSLAVLIPPEPQPGALQPWEHVSPAELCLDT